MPGKVKVRILAGRNLPVMDKSSDTSDAFVEVKLGNTTYKTEVFRRSLNPYWNSEWFRFEVDDEELQDEPLQIRIMDYDTYSANDAIGKVYIDLNPLLSKDSNHVMSGWFPIYDTMHGIRGEVNCLVKVALFSDSNRYRQSSCGVKFFYSPGVPHNYTCQAILGFVEELVVNHDPEYQWIDKIRTPRASNEARQTLFSKLSGEVKRRIGLKAIDLGGNSVVGYQQYFDMEGESGIVVRGIGTALLLSKIGPPNDSNINQHEFDIFEPLPIAFLTPCFTSHNSYPWSHSSHSSTPSPPIPRRPNRSPSPTQSRFPASFLKLFKSNVSISHSSSIKSKKRLPIGVSHEAECHLEKNKVIKEPTHHGLKRVASQPVTASIVRSHSSVFTQNTYASAIKGAHNCSNLSLIRSNSLVNEESTNVNANVANMAVSSSSPPIAPPLNVTHPPSTTPIMTPAKGSPLKASQFNSTTFNHQRRSSESDISITPKANSFGPSHSSIGSAGKSGFKFLISPESLHLLEYPFITMKVFPLGFIQNIGGVVSARSVKLLDQINNPDEPETRDAWWTELRKEIRSHTRALGCNAVLGYSESTHIADEICILSASGTAAILRTSKSEQNILNLANQIGTLGVSGTQHEQHQVINDLKQAPKDANDLMNQQLPTLTKSIKVDINAAKSFANNEEQEKISSTPANNVSFLINASNINCSLCHIPYSETSVPFPSNLVRCAICKKAKVPDILFMTIEPPPYIPITGHGTIIQARVCRTKKETKGEQSAKEISDSLPFLEYELHRQLLSKLKVKGMNGLFNITIQVSFGDNMLVALATGTGAYLSPLPTPLPPKIASGKGVLCSKLNEIQTLILESTAKNREHYNLTSTGNNLLMKNAFNDEMTHVSGDESHGIEINGCDDHVINSANAIDLNDGNKDSFYLEVDDNEDADIISLMIDSDVPKGYEVCNSETLPGMPGRLVCNLQMFTQVYRTKVTTVKQFGHQFDWIIQSLFVKFRRLVPCCLTNLRFRVDLPESDSVQITVVGTAVGIGAPKIMVHGKHRRHTNESDRDELMFAMDEEQTINDQPSQVSPTGSLYHHPPIEHYGIELTPLSYIPGATIENYFGNLDFFFIRESSSIREYGGLNGFMHSFMMEVMAIVRAHVCALGGNALTAFHTTQLILFYNPHKNQAQCLINVAGDAVTVHYDGNKEKSNSLTRSVIEENTLET